MPSNTDPTRLASPPPTSRFVDVEAARLAVNRALPSIEAAVTRPEVSAMKVLHLVLLDPAVDVGSGAPEPVVLYEASVGDRARWNVDYASYAHAKARLSWRHRMDSRQLQLMLPHRLRADDGLLWGGIWLDGLVVAASGALPIWDEAFALTAAAQLRAVAWERAERARESA